MKAVREVRVTQITTRFNSGVQKSISEHTTCQTFKWIGYSSRRPVSLKSQIPNTVLTESVCLRVRACVRARVCVCALTSAVGLQ